MLEAIFIIIAILGFVPVGIFVYVLIRSYQLEREVELFIADYRTQLTGSNRFLFDEQIMRTIFKGYSDYIIHKVWAKLVLTKAIERDSLDGSWCIK